MKQIVNFFQMYGFHPLLFAKDYTALARHYLVVPNRVHRFFTIATAIIAAVLIVLFLVYAVVEKYEMTGNPLFGNVRFSFVDWGYPETFGYVLELFSIGIFVAHGVLHKKKHWFAWAAIFFIVLLDDSIGAHEVLGSIFFDEETLSPVMGGLAVFAMMGVMFVILWVIGLMAMPHNESEFSAYILLSVYFAALVLVGVGVDAVHEQIRHSFYVPETILTLVEDGSELFLTALMAITALGLWYRNPAMAQQHVQDTLLVAQ